MVQMERRQPKFQPVKSVRRSLDPRRIRLDLNQRRTTIVYVPEGKRRSVCGGSATNEWTNVEERKVERNGQRDGQTDGRVTQIGSAEAMLRRLGSSIESMVAHHSDVFIVPFTKVFTVFDSKQNISTHTFSKNSSIFLQDDSKVGCTLSCHLRVITVRIDSLVYLVSLQTNDHFGNQEVRGPWIPDYQLSSLISEKNSFTVIITYSIDIYLIEIPSVIRLRYLSSEIRCTRSHCFYYFRRYRANVVDRDAVIFRQ